MRIYPIVCGLITLLFCSFVAQADDSSFIVKDINVKGLERISAGTVFNYLPIKVNDTFTEKEGQAAIRALYKTGFFSNVSLSRSGNILVVTVQERPSVTSVKIEGSDEISEEDLKKSLKDVGLAEGRVFNRSVLEKIETELKRQYFSRGRYSVQVKTTVTPLERNRVSINIEIKEGSVARIQEINFTGNLAYSDDELLDRISLGESGFFGSLFGADKYSREKLLADREAIRSYYQDNGFMEFQLESTQVSIAPDKESIFINISINEGLRFTVTDIKLAGKMVVPEEDIQKLITIEKGDIFSRRKISEITKAITELLGNQGYAFAKVNPIPEINHDASEVSFTIFIDPGKRVYVRRIEFTGNTNTRDEVLRREMRQIEGGWFSTSNLNRSRVRLQRLGFFDEVNIETPKVPGVVDQVDVKIGVKERPTGNLLFGVGYSDVDGFLINGSLTESNLFGTGKSLSVSFDNSKSTKTVRTNYTDPYFTDSGILGGYQLYFTEVDSEQADTAPYVLSTAGGGLFFRLPIAEERHIRTGLAYEVNTLTVAEDGAKIAKHFVQKYGRKTGALKLTGGWSQDSLNSAIFPTSGAFERISFEATIPGSEVEYYRTNISTGIYLPVSRVVTFRAKAEYDVGYGYGDTTTLPFYKNYFAGGSNTVRAYRPRSLGPRDLTTDQPIGGNKRFLGNLEVFFPMPGTDADNKAMRLSLFVDSGMVYGPGAEPDLNLLKYSSGLAFSWFSPIGPLSFSYGFPLNEEQADETEKIQFSIGVPFR